MPWNNNCFCSVKALSLVTAGLNQTLSCHVPLALGSVQLLDRGMLTCWLPEGTREQE